MIGAVAPRLLIETETMRVGRGLRASTVTEAFASTGTPAVLDAVKVGLGPLPPAPSGIASVRSAESRWFDVKVESCENGDGGVTSQWPASDDPDARFVSTRHTHTADRGGHVSAGAHDLLTRANTHETAARAWTIAALPSDGQPDLEQSAFGV